MHRRMKTLLGCLLGVAFAVPAIAQSGSSLTQYPACPDPPPKLSKVEFEAAHAAYNVGMEAYASSDYQKALDNFKEAFRRDCSRVALLDFIARAYEGKGDRGEAIHALETYLQRNPKAADAETIQTRIQNLRALMQQQPTATAPTATVTVTATATAEPTTTATVAPTATATGTEPHGHTAGPWIVVGVGAVAAIAGGIIIAAGQIQYSNAEQGCSRDPSTGALTNCPATPTLNQREASESSAVDIRGAGIAIAGVGVAAIIGGLIWHFVEPTGGKNNALLPMFGPGYGGLSFSSRF
jgi:tetratricopeptide (TPR) repeat protein